MRVFRAVGILALLAAVSLPLAAPAVSVAHAASGLGVVASVQAQDHPEVFDEPHPAGVTETPSGAAAAAADVPTGSPLLAGDDLSAGAGPDTSGTMVTAGEPPVMISGPAPDHPDAMDPPHPTGVTETASGAAAAAAGQVPETGE